MTSRSSSSSSGFAHQRLDAYRVSQELAAGVVRLTREFPRGYADLRDQLGRSAMAVVRHIAEGANRHTPADKRARFVIARGECGECDASLETADMLDLAPAASIQDLRSLADRVGAMLTGLVRREAAREAAAPK
jgi:four helix bundle protein